MSTLGANTKLRGGKTSGARTGTNLTLPAAGTETIGFQEARDTRAIPGGRGIAANQLANSETYDFNFTTDSNSQHDTLLRDIHGQRLYLQLREEGDTKPGWNFEGPVSASLSFDLESDAVTWDITLNVDGLPAAVPGPLTGTAPAITPVESYRMSMCKFYFGGAGFLADLTPAAAGTIALNGIMTPSRRKRIAGTGVIGRTAKGVTASYGLTGPFDIDSTELAKITANRVGYFALLRATTEANYAYVIPMGVSARPRTYPATGFATMNLSFVQVGGGAPVAAVPTGAGTLTVPAGSQGYIVDVTGGSISRVTANGTVPADGFGVVGTGVKAEGVT